MIITDQVVIAALLKDAKKFKSKWELHTKEPIRSKPNINFLKRTLSNVVKVNQGIARQAQRNSNNKEEDDEEQGSHHNKEQTTERSNSPTPKSNSEKSSKSKAARPSSKTKRKHRRK